ncbi:DUF881 domain-containing protein [Nocardioides anomalus]|uniref:DUF881 domain-containing protein n=1 Tax=Nocardioides anomalus TaxID=2712223 RepID=A0A6G6WDK0_9ACTN|nr:DUF881 domain-containing protein [Nocardioides anomalus]QIG43289.1 DUF881 domain-containing protein [Nocardioides anomalus]
MPDRTPDLGSDRAPEERSWPEVDRRQDGRSRLWHALTKPSRGQVVVGVLLALVGFAAVTQVRTNTVDSTYAGLREQDLIDILNDLAGTTQRTESEIQRLEERRDDLQSDTSARQAALDEARQRTQVLSVLAGTVPVSGSGITIRIEEGEDGEPVQVGPFIDMVQALRTAGAEALQVNGKVRVVAQTAFEQDSRGLTVDGTPLSPPYTVDVIGPPTALISALRFPDGPQDQFEDDGAELSFDEVTTVEVDTTTDPADADVAQPQQ